ncbi:transketolase family protein [Prochlorococcus sp. MIT 1300]|uniref:transketolase family protein n=1 Tax=Prochlorococcus sp. MIT 1300 TaxID=3096218 RepID=UPI002A7542E4|nr:transketolase C-terminal domain-containing protein [Prochlorococcus sp. MIT 1300]
MRNAFAQEITNLAKVREDIVLLSGDIGNRMFDSFKEIAPNRFINCGIAEANMMSLASGMALTGLKPVIYTITPFTTTRCLEQIKIGVAYHQASVVIVGTGSGLSYAELGATHHSLEDIAIIKALPGIRILAPADSAQLKVQFREAIELGGPTYIRIGKKGEPNIHNESNNLGIGKANIVRSGEEVMILSIGPIVNEALIASDSLRETGLNVGVSTMGSVRPLDELFLNNLIDNGFHKWVVLEEHYKSGGLATTVLEWLLETNNTNNISLYRIGCESEFIHELGDQSYTRQLAKIDYNGIINKIMDI